MGSKFFYSQFEVMAKDFEGPFSAGLVSLQLQLKTLLEEAGGDHAAKLLDALCKLSRAEQGLTIDLFVRTIGKLVQGNLRLASKSDQQLKEFEDRLYGDLVSAMNEASVVPTGRKLEVINGGRPSAQDRSTLDFSTALRAKRQKSGPILN